MREIAEEPMSFPTYTYTKSAEEYRRALKVIP
jgi:hypothetical protein